MQARKLIGESNVSLFVFLLLGYTHLPDLRGVKAQVLGIIIIIIIVVFSIFSLLSIRGSIKKASQPFQADTSAIAQPHCTRMQLNVNNCLLLAFRETCRREASTANPFSCSVKLKFNAAESGRSASN